MANTPCIVCIVVKRKYWKIFLSYSIKLVWICLRLRILKWSISKFDRVGDPSHESLFSMNQWVMSYLCHTFGEGQGHPGQPWPFLLAGRVSTSGLLEFEPGDLVELRLPSEGWKNFMGPLYNTRACHKRVLFPTYIMHIWIYKVFLIVFLDENKDRHMSHVSTVNIFWQVYMIGLRMSAHTHTLYA